MINSKLDYIVKYNFDLQQQGLNLVANSATELNSAPNPSEVDLSIIWLHGLGADCNDFLPIVDQLQLNRKVQFIFPNAPMRPITINAGYTMRAWYDISSLVEIDQSFDYIGVMESVAQVNQIIAKQIEQNIDPSKILIAGFSQGGVVSYFTHLTTPYKLAGSIALSCYLPILKEDFHPKLSQKNQDSPIFIAHGQDDFVVPYIAGERAYQILSGMGYLASWHSYPIGHNVSDSELLDLSKWIDSISTFNA